jgi:hypothetical protein
MSKIEVDAIDKQSGSTLTLGGSGTAVTLACGATQTGFGRSGSVNWDTTAKTAGFTGVNGNGYFINTTSGPITVNLPASPSAGDIMAVKDYTGTAGTSAITVGRNGSPIRSATSDFEISANNAGATFIYVDGSEGWQVFVDGSDSDAQESFMSATGGTISCSGNFRIHTFTGPGTFAVSEVASNPANSKVDYVVVGGGGAGYVPDGGGGGAGGYRESPGTTTCYTASPLGASPATALPVGIADYPVTVGGGGASNSDGSSSTFTGTSTITSAGGGRGGSYTNTGNTGGSGGGSGRDGGGPAAGNTPSVTPAQGNPGGYSNNSCGTNQDWNGGGGGGGAGAGGGNGTGNGSPGPEIAGPGGNGVTTQIPGSPLTLAGGGGGSLNNSGSCAGNPSGPRVGQGGTGGGGRGALSPSPGTGCAGTANTGGGGGGAFTGTGQTGGSGVVIIRYKKS